MDAPSSGLDLTQTSHTDAGIYTDTWTFTDLTGNYNNASGQVSDTIGALAITVTGGSLSPITYDGSAHAVSACSSTQPGFVTCSNSMDSVGPNAGSGSIAPTANIVQGIPGDYTLTSNNGSWAINKADAACSVTAIPGLVYNGSAQTTLTGSCTGVTGGVAPAFRRVHITTHGQHPNLTISCNPTASGLDLSCGSHTNAGNYSDTWAYNDTTGNYNTTSGTVNTSIGQAMISVTADSKAMTYGGTVPTLTGTLTGVLGADGITASYGTTGTSASSVGSYPITATLNDSNSKLGNYSVSNTPGTLTINQATPVISWTPPAPMVYGTALNATVLNASANAAGTFIYLPASGTVLTAGYHKLTVYFTPSDPTDYTSVYATVLVQVSKLAPVITWATPSSITYGTALDGTQLNATANAAGTLSYTPAAGTVLTGGAHKLNVTFTPADTADYSTTSASVTIVVSKVVPVVSWATPAAISYGTALDGTQLNASTTTTTGTFTYTPAATTVLTAGTHKLNVTFTPSDTADYTTTTASVQIQVSKLAPVITWATPSSITYGTALDGTQLNATANVAGTFVYTPAAGTVLSGGTHKLNVTFTPSDATDYTTTTASVQLQVNKLIPVITWATPSSITYGTALDGTQLNATSNVAGTFTYTPAAGTVLTAGTHKLVATFTPTDTANDATVNSSVMIVVTKASPVITWANPATIYYGTTLSATQLNATANVPGTFTYTPGAGTLEGVGTHTLSVKFIPTDTANYSNSTATVSLQVVVPAS